MMNTRVKFGEAFRQVAFSSVPDDVKLQLSGSVLEPPVLFIKLSALFFFDGALCKSHGCLVISLHDSRWLSVSKVFKAFSNGNSAPTSASAALPMTGV